MAATAEYAVCDAISRYWRTNSTGLSAGEYVCGALRSAGWIRSSPYAESASEDRIAQLERDLARLTTERDQASHRQGVLLRERDEARVDREAWARAYRRALATAASPEVMRVLERAEACHRRWRLRPPGSPEALALFAAVDALSASRQPKAQEPRYEVVRRKDDALPWAVGDNEGGWASTHRFQAGAEAECARLNGEAK